MFGVLEILFMNSFMNRPCFHRRHLLDGVLQAVFTIEPEKNSVNQRGKKYFFNVMKFLEQNWEKMKSCSRIVEYLRIEPFFFTCEHFTYWASKE